MKHHMKQNGPKHMLKLFYPELRRASVQEKLPLIKWQDCEKAPGTFSIYLLAQGQYTRAIDNNFQDRVCHGLVNDEPLHILSAKNSTFRLPAYKGGALYFVELTVLVKNDLHLTLIQANLPSLAEEIKLPSSPKLTSSLFASSLNEKSSQIFDYLRKFRRKSANPEFEQEIFHAMQRFLFQLPHDFDLAHTPSQLGRIIACHYFFKKKYLSTGSAYKRHLYFKLLPSKRLHTLGIAIALNTLGEYEQLRKRHLVHAIQRLCPQAHSVSNSFYSSYETDGQFLTLYIEFTKEGGVFSQEELTHLRSCLGRELKDSIEYLTPALYTPKNAEELYRNILSLSEELKMVHDLPQAIITFEGHKNGALKFEVILVRVLGKDSLPLERLRSRLPSQIKCQLEKLTHVGLVRKKYIKEANCFSLEIEGASFLRKNHSFDLVQARHYIVHLIERLVGNFRDFHGGFLLEQDRKLQAIKKMVGAREEFLLEKLFYALCPVLWQALIPPLAGKELFTLFLTLLERDFAPSESWIMEKKRVAEGLIIHCKVASAQIQAKLCQRLKEYQRQALDLITASFDWEGGYYCSVFYLTKEKDEQHHLIEAIHQSLQPFKKKKPKSVRTRPRYSLIFNTARSPVNSALIQRSLKLAKDNPVKAKQVLEQGLKKLALTPRQLPVLAFSYNEETEIVAQEIGRGWEEILGLRVRYEKLLAAYYYQAIREQKYMVSLCSSREKMQGKN